MVLIVAPELSTMNRQPFWGGGGTSASFPEVCGYNWNKLAKLPRGCHPP